jgi:5'-3' exonuclease
MTCPHRICRTSAGRYYRVHVTKADETQLRNIFCKYSGEAGITWVLPGYYLGITSISPGPDPV